jgi:hypothetical protein
MCVAFEGGRRHQRSRRLRFRARSARSALPLGSYSAGYSRPETQMYVAFQRSRNCHQRPSFTTYTDAILPRPLELICPAGFLRRAALVAAVPSQLCCCHAQGKDLMWATQQKRQQANVPHYLSPSPTRNCAVFNPASKRAGRTRLCGAVAHLGGVTK